MARSTQTASSNGAGARNLFCESEENPAPAPTKRSAGRCGRGLIVASDEPAAGPSEAGAARFTRASSGLNALPAIARQRAARADRTAKRLLERIAAQHYGAVIALLAVAALLLSVGGLGLSLRAASERDHLRDQRATTSRALIGARVQARALSAQRDRALQQATAAHARQLRAQRSAQGWQARARREQRQLADARKAATRRKRER